MKKLMVFYVVISFLAAPWGMVRAEELAEDETTMRCRVQGNLAQQQTEADLEPMLAEPEPVELGGGVCGAGTFTTSSETGEGDNCLRARHDLLQQLQTQVSCTHGVCNELLVIEVPCDPQPDGTFHLIGHLLYQCYLK